MLRPVKTNTPLVGHQMAFLTIVGFWVFHAMIVSLRSALMEFPSQDELALRRIMVTVVGIALTWLLYLVLRMFDRRPLGVRVATAFVAAIPCAISIAYANYYIFNLYDPANLFADQSIGQNFKELQEQLRLTGLQEIAEIAVTRYFFIIAWASLYLALGYAREVREAERTASRYARAAHDAELRSLRYQVNPHFLFNTLNSLSSLVISRQNDRAEAMIQNLASFYRTSLSSDPLDDVTLAEEVELQKHYLGIEAVRYPERLRTHFDIPDALEDFPLPAMILQPLVENAIKYGVARTNRPVTISITARKVDDLIAIAVEDDGDPSDQTGIASSGIGLANVRDRLEARFGEGARLIIQKGDQGGFVAKIEIQIEQKSEA